MLRLLFLSSKLIIWNTEPVQNSHVPRNLAYTIKLAEQTCQFLYIFIPSFRPWPGLWLPRRPPLNTPLPPSPTGGAHFSLLAPLRLLFLKPLESWPSGLFSSTPFQNLMPNIFPPEPTFPSAYVCSLEISCRSPTFSCPLTSSQLMHLFSLLPAALHQTLLPSLEICPTCHFPRAPSSPHLLPFIASLWTSDSGLLSGLFSLKNYLSQL